MGYFLGAGVELKLYLCRKRMGFYKNSYDIFFIQDFFRVFYSKKNISNAPWLEILSRELIFLNPQNKIIFLLYNFIMGKVYDLIIFFKMNSLLITLDTNGGYFRSYKKDIEIYKQNKNPLIQLSKEEVLKCEKEYENLNKIMKIKSDQSIITLCNRDGAYKKQQLPNMDLSYHNFRNFDVQDYELCVRNMIKKNFYIVRMGNITEKKLELSDPNFFDYSKSKCVSSLMDIYLIYKSKFFIGPESGLDKIANFFRKPIILINVHHLLTFRDYKNNNKNKSLLPNLSKEKFLKCNGENIFFIPQKLFDLNNKRYLTFSEMLDPEFKKNKRNGEPVGHYSRNSDYEEANIKVINNTPEEINDVTEEMNLYIDGKLELSDRDLELQKKFWSKFNDEFLYSETYKISPTFLRKNEGLLV